MLGAGEGEVGDGDFPNVFCYGCGEGECFAGHDCVVVHEFEFEESMSRGGGGGHGRWWEGSGERSGGEGEVAGGGDDGGAEVDGRRGGGGGLSCCCGGGLEVGEDFGVLKVASDAVLYAVAASWVDFIALVALSVSNN